MNVVADDRSKTLLQLAHGQLEGKNKAIHAYDQMIWTVRTGFVTLFFGGWGFLFKEMLTIPALRPFHFAVVAGLWFVSIGLALAADRIERSYVRRKFRVIASVNRLLAGLNGDRVDVEAVRAELRIAGDTDDETFAISGFTTERAAGRWIYAVSLVGSTVAIVVLWLAAGW